MWKCNTLHVCGHTRMFLCVCLQVYVCMDTHVCVHGQGICTSPRGRCIPRVPASLGVLLARRWVHSGRTVGARAGVCVGAFRNVCMPQGVPVLPGCVHCVRRGVHTLCVAVSAWCAHARAL